MFHRRILVTSLLLFSSLPLLGNIADAIEHFSPRQYYSGWNRHPTANYHFRRYYYKPTPQFSGFKHHFVVFHPARPRHVYFYNPYKRQYWGRCELNLNGRAEYSMLQPEHRKGTLQEIPESAFPPPSPVPPIPESVDNVPLDLPPDDLPSLDAPHATAPPAE